MTAAQLERYRKQRETAQRLREAAAEHTPVKTSSAAAAAAAAASSGHTAAAEHSEDLDWSLVHDDGDLPLELLQILIPELNAEATSAASISPLPLMTTNRKAFSTSSSIIEVCKNVSSLSYWHSTVDCCIAEASPAVCSRSCDCCLGCIAYVSTAV
jgi:hypothetical protein